MSDDDTLPDQEPGWDRGFARHAESQRRRIAALPHWVRIDRFEETQRLLARMRRVDPPADPDEFPS